MHAKCRGEDPRTELNGAVIDCVRNLISVWAVGANDFDMPLDAGFPLDPSDTYDTLMLEVHYNNPDLDSGIIDDTGLIWYVTNNLRTHDVGIFYIGHITSTHMRIPPQVESFLFSTHCSGECTNLFPHPLNVIATFPHSHTAGASIWTQIIRDKKEIDYLDLNLNYDFDFQVIIL